MMTLYTIFGMFVGFEGYDNGKVYFGIYTPQYEYGYVVTPNEIYLDTILEKSQDQCLTMPILIGTLDISFDTNPWRLTYV